MFEDLPANWRTRPESRRACGGAHQRDAPFRDPCAGSRSLLPGRLPPRPPATPPPGGLCCAARRGPPGPGAAVRSSPVSGCSIPLLSSSRVWIVRGPHVQTAATAHTQPGMWRSVRRHRVLAVGAVGMWGRRRPVCPLQAPTPVPAALTTLPLGGAAHAGVMGWAPRPRGGLTV